MQNNMFQPGVILQEVIIGAFKARGLTFRAWCLENEINPNVARSAAYGQSGGAKGQALLARIIDAAGRDVVAMVYRQRVKAEADKLAEVAA